MTRTKLTVWYDRLDNARSVFELNISDRSLVEIVLGDLWFSVVGTNTGKVYFACPREHIISVKEY
jgi:hypothetical protein